eukprot:6356623-Heterocapsa_arctica.AAC.1
MRMSAGAAAALSEAHTDYIRCVRDRIAGLPKGSKAWWRLNRVLLNRSRKSSCIPPLRTDDGQWVLDAKSKANIFAQSFAEKGRLPPGPAGEVIGEPSEHMS